MTFNIKLPICFIALFIWCLASHASAEIMGTPPSGYLLTYKFKDHLVSPLPKEDPIYTIGETDKGLLITLRGSKERDFTFFYDKKMSLIVPLQRGSTANYRTGFWYSLLPVTVAMPFNLRTFEFFGPAARVLEGWEGEQLESWKALVGERKHGVYATTITNGPDLRNIYYPCSFVFENGVAVRLVAGVPQQMLAEVRYLKYRSLGQVMVPSLIEVHAPSGGKLLRTFTLTKAEVRQDHIPKLEDLIPRGQFVTASDDRGAAATDFNPEAGTLESQLEEQRKVRIAADKSAAERKIRESSSNIALILASVFALLALILISVKARAGKTRQ